MKVIFLDIDGVLNTYSTRTTVAGYNFVEDHLIQMLKQLVERTGAKLVLSSTWREGWDMLVHPEDFPCVCQEDVRLYEALVEKLREYDLELIDYTPIFGVRGQEIDRWLQNSAPEPVEAYVILDDMDGRFLRPHSRYLVQTGMSEGLSQRHVDKAIKILCSQCTTNSEEESDDG